MIMFNRTRRAFLKIVAGLGLYAFMRPVLSSPVTVESFTSALASRMVSIFNNELSAKVVGAEYLRLSQSDADLEHMLDSICRTCGHDTQALMDKDDQQLRDVLVARQRQDFSEGQTVRVQGWVLSKTEARLCALTTLL